MRWWGTQGDLALVVSPKVIVSHFHLSARALMVMAVTCGVAEAHPLHVRDSFPAAEAILDGRNAQYIVRFDGWVDHGASRMDITENGKIVEPLVPTRDSEPDVLAASASALPPGRYQLHWHAKSVPDGGAAYLDGMLFRGTDDGRVLAYDFKTGNRLWETTIADVKKGEDVPAAPIAWEGLVFIGNAGGDFKGAKGHMYALDAKTGKIVWQFFLVPKTEGDTVRGPEGASPLDTSTWKNIPGAPISGGGTWTSTTLDPATGLLYVPVGNPAPDYDNSVRQGDNLFTGSVVVLDAKTGAYKNHFQLVPRDWHDWDVSNPPVLIKTRAGKRLMAVSPKDGHLYGFDLADNKLLYRTPVTRIENVEEPFAVDKDVHFCPGAAGGEEWNSPGYDPLTNLIFTGDVDWCVTVMLQTREEIAAAPLGQLWTGDKYLDPFNQFGKFSRADGYWAGWLYATDADTGVWKWRLKSNYPIMGAVTPTAGGLVFFGDLGGNFYAIDAATGQKLWGQKIGGAIGGGVITYTVNGTQKVAVATGYVAPAFPAEIRRARIAILGVEGATSR